MELFWWIIGIVWIIGWIKELATVQSKMAALGLGYPNNGVKYAMPIVLFVTWPYFYFYGNQ